MRDKAMSERHFDFDRPEALSSDSEHYKASLLALTAEVKTIKETLEPILWRIQNDYSALESQKAENEQILSSTRSSIKDLEIQARSLLDQIRVESTTTTQHSLAHVEKMSKAVEEFSHRTAGEIRSALVDLEGRLTDLEAQSGEKVVEVMNSAAGYIYQIRKDFLTFTNKKEGEITNLLSQVRDEVTRFKTDQADMLAHLSKAYEQLFRAFDSLEPTAPKRSQILEPREEGSVRDAMLTERLEQLEAQLGQRDQAFDTLKAELEGALQRVSQNSSTSCAQNDEDFRQASAGYHELKGLLEQLQSHFAEKETMFLALKAELQSEIGRGCERELEFVKTSSEKLDTLGTEYESLKNLMKGLQTALRENVQVTAEMRQEVDAGLLTTKEHLSAMSDLAGKETRKTRDLLSSRIDQRDKILKSSFEKRIRGQRMLIILLFLLSILFNLILLPYLQR